MRRELSSSRRSPILVTGVTSGLGQETARRLRANGHHVVGVVRHTVQGGPLLDAGVCDAVITADLEHEETLRAIPAQLADQGAESLAAVIHCAAVTDAAPLETMPSADVRRLAEINLFGSITLVQVTADLLRRARGRLVLVGSVAGFSVWPMLGVYAITKHAMEALADSARRELSPWGVSVCLARPGGITTRMYHQHLAEMNQRIAVLAGEEQRRYGGIYRSYTKSLTDQSRTASSPDRIADALVRVIERRRMPATICLGKDCKALRVLDYLPERALDAVVSRAIPATPAR